MPDEIKQEISSHLGWRDIGGALRYPARRGPLLFMAAAALCLTVRPLGGGLLGLWPPLLAGLKIPLTLAAGVLGLGALLVLPSYCGDIVRRAASGEDGPPPRPRLSQPQSLVMPALKLIAVVLWSFLPLLLYIAALGNGQRPSLPLVLVLFAIASFYLPMALLLLVMKNKLWPSLMPSNVIDPIVRTFRGYWRVWLLMLVCALFLPGSALLVWIPVAGPTLAVFIGLYLLCSAMHALGRFYRMEATVLDWKPENDTAQSGQGAESGHQE